MIVVVKQSLSVEVEAVVDGARPRWRGCLCCHAHPGGGCRRECGTVTADRPGEACYRSSASPGCPPQGMCTGRGPGYRRPCHTTTGTGEAVVLVADRGAGGLGPADRAETARTGQQLPIRLLGLPPAYDAALNTQHRGWPTRRDSKIKVHSRTLGRSTRCGWYSAVGVRVAMSSSTSPSKLRSCRASCWRWKHSVLSSSERSSVARLMLSTIWTVQPRSENRKQGWTPFPRWVSQA